jgi:hypothetical protein
VPYRSGSSHDPKATITTPLGQILKTALSGEGPSPFRSLPDVMRARAFPDERGLAMGGGRPTERRFRWEVAANPWLGVIATFSDSSLF